MAQLGELSGTIIDDTYYLETFYGSGAVSTVYRGINQSSGERVAIKIMKTGLLSDKDVISRFRREINTVCALAHKNIVRVLGGGVLRGGEPYIVMECLEGRSLTDILQKERQLSIERAVNLIAQAADALGYTHTRGFIHRDVKPENLMIVREAGGAEVVKVLDFGIAKILDNVEGFESLITRPGEVVGTPLFMSPEQISGEFLDGRTDIYSLGCVLYECLTGHPPFGGATPIDVMRNHLECSPRPLKVADPSRQYPPELERLVQHALAKLPVDRIQTMESFAASLRTMRKSGSQPKEIVNKLVGFLKKR